MFKKISLTFALIALPIFANAQFILTEALLSNLKDNIVVRILVPLSFTLAVLFFFWGVAKYIWSSGGDKDEGKKIMYWGVIALFVMSSVWGLVAFMQRELTIPTGTTGTIPTIK